jgi:hypothetical protein
MALVDGHRKAISVSDPVSDTCNRGYMVNILKVARCGIPEGVSLPHQDGQGDDCGGRKQPENYRKRPLS